MAPKVGYMHLPIIQYYQEQIRRRSRDTNYVDNMWNNILPMYFSAEQGYGVEMYQQQPGPDAADKIHEDYTIRCIRKGQSIRIVLIAENRMKFESTNRRWLEAPDQVRGYLKSVCADIARGSDQVLYVMLALSYVMGFYAFLPVEMSLAGILLSNGKTSYELEEDEEGIDTMLLQLVDWTK